MLLVLGLTFGFTVLPASAHAAPKLAIFNTGEHLFTAGDLPAPYASDPELQGFSAGYRCDVFGVFWAYLAWWDCKPAAVSADQDTYADDPTLVAAIDAVYDPSDIQTGLWEGKARWLLLVLVLFGGGAMLYEKITGKNLGRDEEEDAEAA
jgi:hypothetical protein